VINYTPRQAGRALLSGEYGAMVLLVDDQLMVAEAVRRALADEPDIDFHFCSDATRAIEVAQQISPTIILQDLVMPGTDGLSLVSAYRAHASTRTIPVIVLSSREEARTKQDAFAAGANDYLVKLPDRIELIARIRYHTRAYLNQLQRDEAYNALRESQRQLMEANLELQRLTNQDGLTGLNNRRRFDEYADSEWRRAARDSCDFALLLVDVDDFKRYNDTYGHIAGDSVLKQVAAAIRACCSRPGDLPARFGGEEFAIILPNTNSSGARNLAENIRRAVEELRIPHTGSTSGEYLTLSIGGIAARPQPGDSLLEVIVKADKALYEAKSKGKNRVEVVVQASAACLAPNRSECPATK
jgi:two-component system, chemotaxis family, response regulator WspR